MSRLEGSDLCNRDPERAQEYAKALLEVVEGSGKQLKEFTLQRDRAQAEVQERASSSSFFSMAFFGYDGSKEEEEKKEKKEGDAADSAGGQEEDWGFFSWMWGSSSADDGQSADPQAQDKLARSKRGEQSSGAKGSKGERRPQKEPLGDEAIMLSADEDLKFLRSLNGDDLGKEVARRNARVVDKRKVLDQSRMQILGAFNNPLQSSVTWAENDQIMTALEDRRRMICWTLYTTVQQADTAAAKAAEALGYLTRKAVLEMSVKFTQSKDYKHMGIENWPRLANWRPKTTIPPKIASTLTAGRAGFWDIDVHGEMLLSTEQRPKLNSLSFLKDILCVPYENMPSNLVRHTQRLLARLYDEAKRRPISTGHFDATAWPEDVVNGVFKPPSNKLLSVWVCEVLLNSLRTSQHAFLDATKGLEASLSEPLGTTFRSSLVQISDLAVQGHRAAYKRLLQEGFGRRKVPWYTQVLVVRELSRQVGVNGLESMDRLLHVLLFPERVELQQAAHVAIVDALKAAPLGDTSLEEATSALARSLFGQRTGVHPDSQRHFTAMMEEARVHRVGSEKALRHKTWQSKTKINIDHKLGDEVFSLKKDRLKLARAEGDLDAFDTSEPP